MAGWCPDPVTLGVARYWAGTDWASYVLSAGRELVDPTPLATVRHAADIADAELVRGYVADAVECEVVDSVVAATQLRWRS
jgi:hypothetical protein